MIPTKRRGRNIVHSLYLCLFELIYIHHLLLPYQFSEECNKKINGLQADKQKRLADIQSKEKELFRLKEETLNMKSMSDDIIR